MKKKEKGSTLAEVIHKTDIKGQAHRMFLHRDNHMQSQGYEQSGTLKILLSIHTPKSRTIRVKMGLPHAEVTHKTDT